MTGCWIFPILRPAVPPQGDPCNGPHRPIPFRGGAAFSVRTLTPPRSGATVWLPPLWSEGEPNWPRLFASSLMRNLWKVLLAAALSFPVLCGVAFAAEEPVLTGCICFDPTNRMSRQEARNNCDYLNKFAGAYRAGVLRPSAPCDDVQCDVQDGEGPPPRKAWACFGVGPVIPPADHWRIRFSIL